MSMSRRLTKMISHAFGSELLSETVLQTIRTFCGECMEEGPELIQQAEEQDFELVIKETVIIMVFKTKQKSILA
jgi:hypothetical protein